MTLLMLHHELRDWPCLAMRSDSLLALSKDCFSLDVTHCGLHAMQAGAG